MLSFNQTFKKLLFLTFFIANGINIFAQVQIVLKKSPTHLQGNIDGNEKNSHDNDLDYKECSSNRIFQKLIALKTKYPEGMKWTNDNSYEWKGGVYDWGAGCAGFAFLLSDAAFGNTPARKHFDFNNLRVGDILRINNDTHSVIILCISNNTVTLAEGNYSSTIHWGRTFSLEDIKLKIDYVLTRYRD